MSARPSAIDLVRQRLDLVEVAAAEGLRVLRRARGAHFDCPACRRALGDGKPAAMTRDGVGWKCIRCDEHGDVIDLVRLGRRVTPGDALRLALELAGPLAVPEVSPPRPPPAGPSPSAPPLTDAERAARLRAVQVAATHYLTLAGDDARSRLDFLAETLCGLRKVRFASSLPGLLLARAETAETYLRARLGLADGRPLPDPVRELVGVCPGPDTGLQVDLADHGGPELVSAALSAGILHQRRDGSLVEALAGRLVYVWTDDLGRAVYLSARAVPGLVAAAAPKALGLVVFNPEHRGDRRGVPRVRTPFGLHQARELAASSSTVLVVEGELDALAALCAGVRACATGGTARLDNATGRASLRAALAWCKPIVAFDADESPNKQQKTDERARSLALAIGGRWVPAGRFAHAVTEVLAEGPRRHLRAGL
ncbi:MAG: hypothetical protein IT385_12080 [Deltaproteobacteria bacterium]|nr:hypothetical protein [Deltaproteobacteria bacterium]